MGVDLIDEMHRDQGVAAEIEEAVVEADAVEARRLHVLHPKWNKERVAEEINKTSTIKHKMFVPLSWKETTRCFISAHCLYDYSVSLFTSILTIYLKPLVARSARGWSHILPITNHPSSN